MDPNKALSAIRRLVALQNGPENHWLDNSYAVEAVAVFEELDKWIMNGGALPADWER